MGEAAASRVAPGALGGRLRNASLGFLGREAFSLVFVAATAVGLLIHSRDEFAQDSWLSLLGGRLVLHGLPHHDTLTSWTLGAPWVDQQWLGQVAVYGLYAGGGVRLAMLAGLLLTTGAVAAATAAARWRGVSSIRVGLVTGACLVITAPAWVIRTQTLAAPLFVALLWLLLADDRAPSRRVFLVVPLLVLWANLHGSVVLAGIVVTAYALTKSIAARRMQARYAALVAVAGLAVFASPYGFDLAGYYRRVLFNPGFGNYVTEWLPTSPSLITAPFFAVLLGSFWLLGRSRSLSGFERVALIVTAVLGLAAIRNTLWFGLAAIMILPRALEDVWPVRTTTRARVNSALGLAAATVLAVAIVFAAARPLTWFDHRWPPSAAAAVSRAVARDPSLRVYADLRYGDWLLFERPTLEGRVAADARLELLSNDQLKHVFEITNRIGNWRRHLAGYRLVVLNPRREDDLIDALAADPGARELYRSSWISVQLLRAP